MSGLNGGKCVFLGIDIGTSSVKALLVDANDTVVAQASSPLTVDRPQPLFSEQDPEAWWQATVSAIGSLPTELRSAVRAIGLSGQPSRRSPKPSSAASHRETLDIYTPLAHRLGIQDLKWQLEDLAFAVLHPKRYAEIEQMVTAHTAREQELEKRVLTELSNRLGDLHIDAQVQGRRKHYWSIYEKMVVKGKELDDVKTVGVRVIVDSVRTIYGALGSIHALWAPVQGRFKDYIAMPKFNLYQSLHTTVVGPGGRAGRAADPPEMHRRAEFGIAAHWGYKERSQAEDLAWLQRMVDWQQDTSDPTEFMETLKIDLQQDEVFVFTPKGKVVTLDAGATPVDFAYTIHTEVGHRCIGARINGRLVPLDSMLNSGDTVEIFTSKVEGAGPSLDWLQFVHTPRASTKIRQWFSRERRVDAIDAGEEGLAKALRKEGLPVQKLAKSDVVKRAAEAMHYHDLDTLHTAIGEGHVSARAVAQRTQREPAAVKSSSRSPRLGPRRPGGPTGAARRRPRRGSRRRHGPAVPLLHPGAR